VVTRSSVAMALKVLQALAGEGTAEIGMSPVADRGEHSHGREQMQKTRSLRPVLWALALAATALGPLMLVGCQPSDQRAIETSVANAAQTAVAAGKKQAATQAIVVKETAVAVAVTQAIRLKETAVAAAATTAAQVKQTAEAEIATQIAPKSPTVSAEVQAARAQLKAMSVMQSHWNQVTAPLQNKPGQRSANHYANVIDQFDVSSAELAGRYQAGGAGNADTRCNIFAGDVMRAMGVPLPTKGNLGRGQGDPNAIYTDPMTAQAPLLNDYLNRRLPWVTSAADKGIMSDWVEINPTTQVTLNQLIAHVNAGKPALVSDSGHIAVIRPAQQALHDWQDLIIAQAGASNFLFGALKGHFTGTPQFFMHD